MTVDVNEAARFVATDEDGRQGHADEVTAWSFPEVSNGTLTPGKVVRAAPSGVRLLSLDELLEDLGACIFVADDSDGEPQLSAETAWTPLAAARFALDCADHVLGRLAGSADVARTLGDVVAAARSWLDKSEGADTGLLGRFSRLAMARRLRHEGDVAGGLAFDFAVDAEAAGVDVFEDANWTAAAATRDAVLAAVEAVRQHGAPHLVQAENARYEESASSSAGALSATFETPWGPFHAGVRAGVVPAWTAAAEAAERARQSAGDDSGAAAAEAERAWQRARLLAALRGT